MSNEQTNQSNKILIDEIKSCMIYNPKLGGRYTLEMDLENCEEIMYLATGKYHNSKCPEIRIIMTDSKKEEKIFCGKPVSCVCISKCNNIWCCYLLG